MTKQNTQQNIINYLRDCSISEDKKGKIDITLKLYESDLIKLCLQKGIIPKKSIGKINIVID